MYLLCTPQNLAVQLFHHSLGFEVTILMVKRVKNTKSLFCSLAEVAETDNFYWVVPFWYSVLYPKIFNLIAFLVIFLVSIKGN